jgi:hypothetical protein
MSPTTRPTLGRNDPCHCGSGRKYKACHLDKDEAEARAARIEAAGATPEATTTTSHPEGQAHAKPPKPTEQPWKRSAMNTHGFAQRRRSPRKVGGS